MSTRQDLIHKVVAASCLISLLYGLLCGRDASAQVVTIPIRWCALAEAPSMVTPGLVGEGSRKDVLWRRHARITDNIFLPQCRINLSSAAIGGSPDVVYLTEEDWRPPGTRPAGLAPADVLYSDFEWQLIRNKCSQMWGTKTGILAVHARDILRRDGMMLTRAARGFSYVPTESNSGSQEMTSGVAVIDNAFLLPSSTLPERERDRLDPFDKTFAHELAHSLTLDHGNGEDNAIDGVPPDGTIDGDWIGPAVEERDATHVVCTHDHCLSDPSGDVCREHQRRSSVSLGINVMCTDGDRRSPHNLMQYRYNPLAGPPFFPLPPGFPFFPLFPPDPRGIETYGLVLTERQCVRMREQAIKHIPGREFVQLRRPRANGAVDTLRDAALAYADIDTFGIAVDPTLAVSYFVTQFGALFPQNLNGLQVFFLADMDNNPATGRDTRFLRGFPVGEGVELAVRVGVDVTNGVAIPVATVFAATGDVEFPFRPLVDPRISAEVTTQTLVIDFEDEARRDVAHGVTVTIPTELLPELDVNARLQVVTQTAEGSPIDAATAALTFETPEFPFCEVGPAAADRGERVAINTAGLPPVKEAHALLGTGAGDLIEVARAFTDGAGQVSLPFTVPQGAASGPRLVTVGLTDPNDARTADCVLTVGRRDTEPPVCALMEAVPKSHTTVIAQDTFSGLAAIKVLRAHNADVDIPDFTRGATGAVPVTATKIHPHLPARVELKVVDVAGNDVRCNLRPTVSPERSRDPVDPGKGSRKP